MSRTLTASDRSALIRLASSMPVGSADRRAILAGLGLGISRDLQYKLEELGAAFFRKSSVYFNSLADAKKASWFINGEGMQTTGITRVLADYSSEEGPGEPEEFWKFDIL